MASIRRLVPSRLGKSLNEIYRSFPHSPHFVSARTKNASISPGFCWTGAGSMSELSQTFALWTRNSSLRGEFRHSLCSPGVAGLREHRTRSAMPRSRREPSGHQSLIRATLVALFVEAVMLGLILRQKRSEIL
jgi:hypothetical protein